MVCSTAGRPREPRPRRIRAFERLLAALDRAAPGLGVEADGRSIHDLAERVVVAAEAEGGATAG
jgi:hypothetical protein